MVILGITTIISYGTTQYLFGVLVVPVSTTLHGDRASLSSAYALGLVFAGVLGVPIGSLVDRWGARLLMTVGSAIAGFSLIGLAFVHTLFQFSLLWAPGIGLAMALTFYPVSFTVVANWFERKRGTALAILTLVGGLSSPLCLPLESALLAQFGWRTLLIVLGVLQLAIAMPLHSFWLRRHPEDLGLVPDGKRPLPSASPGPLAGITLREALQTPAFWLLTLAFSFTMLGSTVIQVHQIPALIERGYDPVLAASVAGGLGLASLPGRYIFNLLSERMMPQTLLWGSVAAQAVGMAILILAPSVPWLIVYVVIYGAAYGAISPLRGSVMAAHVGRRAYGSILAFQGISIALCSGLGPVAAGWLYDDLHSYTLAFWLCAGLFLLAALGIALTPRPTTEKEKSSHLQDGRAENLIEQHTE